MPFFESFERLFDAEPEKFDERAAQGENRQNKHDVQHPRFLVRPCNEAHRRVSQTRTHVTDILLKAILKKTEITKGVAAVRFLQKYA